MEAELFRHLPLLGVERDSRGVIREVTDRLLEVERLERRAVIGHRLVEIWPQATAWLELDREALRTRKPLVRLEHSTRIGWLRSTRVPTGRRVLWVAEDVSATLALRAHRALASMAPSGAVDSSVISLLLAGYGARDVAAAIGDTDDALASIARLVAWQKR